ncbi:MAG TPA: hypothetical protein DDZ66_14850 [Firmicutes bacterium]|jgi:uncharacterized FlaG/YvyC family protein|nr:hypothetical protein [Bacillota bacterium]
MKIPNRIHIQPETAELLEGRLPKLALKQVDHVDDVNFKGSKGHHRLSFQYNKELGENVAYLIDTRTGKTVKHLPSATQVDHKIRVKRLMGLHVDKKA